MALINFVGETSDGKKVISGVFRLFETHGLPLSDILSILKQRDYIIDWFDFYQDALSAGMKHDSVIAKLNEAINDSYGTEFKNTVIRRLEQFK
jgi:alanyl-tRNA synthetase